MGKNDIKRYILLVTAEEWNHDADEWLGIYVSDDEVREAYTRAEKWFEGERSKGWYCEAQKLTIFEYDIEIDKFRSINPQSLFNDM